MHGTIGEASRKPHRVIKRRNDWTLKEHEVVISHWPDVDEIERKLPHRSRSAIQNFAGKCNLRKPIHTWTQAQHSLLRRRVAEGMPRQKIANELGLTVLQVGNRMRYSGLNYNRRPPKPTGHALIDSIKKRAYDLNISLKELDEACASGHQFAKYSPARRIHIKHMIKATKVLDGKLAIQWSDL